MFDYLEALEALSRYKTMSQAGSYLRISQSAVSKRISALERVCGKKLIYREGQRAYLTDEGVRILNSLSPHLNEIRSILQDSVRAKQKVLHFGLSESILTSWGAELLQNIEKETSANVQVHGHRGSLIINKVETGELDFGLIAGHLTLSPGLFEEILYQEEMLYVKGQKGPTYCIEPASGTWRAIQSQLDFGKWELNQNLGSFSVITQISKIMHAPAIIPQGIAHSFQIDQKRLKSFRPKVYRPIKLIFKKSKLEGVLTQELLRVLQNFKVR